MGKPLRIMVVCHNRLMLDALCGYLESTSEFDVVATLSSRDVPAMARSTQPRMVVVEDGSPSRPIHHLIEELHTTQGIPSVLLCSDGFEPSRHPNLREAAEFVFLSEPISTLVATIVQRLTQKAVSSEPRAPKRQDVAFSRLTARELEVLRLFAAGHATRAIADELCVSARTVQNHRFKIMSKLDIHTAAGLTRYTIRHGLMPP